MEIPLDYQKKRIIKTGRLPGHSIYHWLNLFAILVIQGVGWQ